MRKILSIAALFLVLNSQGQLATFDAVNAKLAAQNLAQLISANSNNSAFTAQNLQYLADGALKLGDMVGHLEQLQNFYAKLNPYLQTAVVIQRVVKSYSQFTAQVSNLLTQAAQADYINASQRNLLVGQINSILGKAADDYKEVIDAMGQNLKLNDAERLAIAAKFVEKLEKRISDLNSGEIFLSSLRDKYNTKVKDSLASVGDSTLFHRIIADRLFSGNLVYIPSRNVYVDSKTGLTLQDKGVQLTPNGSMPAIPAVEAMKARFNIKSSPNVAARFSDYTGLFHAAGVGRNVELILACCFLCSMIIGLLNVFGVKLVNVGNHQDDTPIVINKFMTWLWSMFVFMILFACARFLF